MVVFTIGFNKKSKIIKEIESAILHSIGKEGFYAFLNPMVEPNSRIHVNGKKAKKLIEVQNIQKFILKTEKIKQEDILLIFDNRYQENNDEILYSLAYALGRKKPNKVSIITIIDSTVLESESYKRNQEIFKKIDGINFYYTLRNKLFDIVADVVREIALKKITQKNYTHSNAPEASELETNSEQLDIAHFL